jgi:hypothetical protein
MPIDFQTRRKYYNRCRPYDPLKPDDDRNVDLDTYSAERGHPVRGLNWADRLAGEILLSDRPVFKLFTGLPGSGKTTELFRLADRLQDPAEANLLPVVINADDVIDIYSPIDVTDVLAVLVHGVERAVAEASGQDPDQALEEGSLERIWNWMTQTDVTLGKGDLAIPSVGKLVVEMKTRPTLRQRIRNTLAVHLTTFVKEVRDAITLIDADAREKLGREGLIIIFDSLEKLRGTTANWDEVLQSAENLFSGGAPHLHLPVNVIYTVPPALATRMRDVDFMPVIKVRDRDWNPYEPGMEAAREIVRRRIPEDILTRLFGDAPWNAADRLIRWSGGYPRDLLKMLQSVIARKSHPVTERDLDTITAEISNEYRELVTADAFNWLAGVARNKFLTLENDGHRRAADQMLANHAVLRYLNDDLWFELHPAVYKIPGVVRAIDDLKDPDAGPDDGC